MTTADTVFAAALRLQQAGTPYALVTVLRAQPPASARPGDKAVVTADGQLRGWVGGGCAQPAVIRTVRQALQDGRARSIRIAPAEPGQASAERELGEVLEFGMSCHSGGTLELFIDPVLPRAQLLRAMATLGPTHQGYARTMALNAASADMARRHLGEDPGWLPVLKNAIGGQIWLANVQLLPAVAGPLLDEDRRLQGDTPSAVHWDRVGWHRLNLGDTHGAVDAFRRAVETAERTGNRHIRHVADSALGVARVAAGDPDGYAHLVAAGERMLAAGYASARADLACASAEALRAAGRLIEAEPLYAEALRASAEGLARADVGFVLAWSRWLRAVGRHDEAFTTLAACADDATAAGSAWEALVTLERLAAAKAAGRPMDLATAAAAVATLDAAGLRTRELYDTLRELPEVPGATALADACPAARRPTG